MSTPRRLRSMLIAPGNQLSVLLKIPRSGPDGAMLDLEDSVPVAQKAEARTSAFQAATLLTTEHRDLAVFVRVNAIGTPFFADDIAGTHPHVTGVTVPKVESVADVERIREAMANSDLGRLSIMAGIETVAGVEYAREILAHPAVVACYFGAEDFIADIGGVRTPGNTEVLYARSRVAAAAHIGGAISLDQVVTNLTDEAVFRPDALQGRAIGYDGKLCIHPAQVGLANAVYTPSDEEVNRARRMLAAYDAAVADGHAVLDFEGLMVDEPLAKQARALLDKLGA